jgi:ABC-type lipoprotein release transport system permease subunit
LGIAISTAVITGALIVGDSVSYSLTKATHYRLGNINQAIHAGDRFFTKDLSEALKKQSDDIYASVLQTQAIALVDGGAQRENNVIVWGVDHQFKKLMNTAIDYDTLDKNSIVISENLASALKLKVGDELLLKLRKASLIPLNAPFVSDQELTVSKRYRVVAIVSKDQYARLSLRNTQTAPFNAFVNIDHLNAAMEMEGRANLILSSSESMDEEVLRNACSIKDYSLRLENHDSLLFVKSDRIFIEEQLSELLEKSDPNARPHLTYFVNSIATKSDTCPYSFVSSDLEIGKGEVIVNRWLADDLNLEVGDSLTLNYFEVGPLRVLDTNQRSFVVKTIINSTQDPSMQALMPEFPGLSDAGNCKEWEAGIPIDFESIRDKDEAYWKDFKGSPKAFINTHEAVEMWGNRFGAYTAFEIAAGDSATFISELKSNLNPKDLGFTIDNVKEDGLYAANNGTDFSSLFIGLSFFIILSGLILSVLLFVFNLEQRSTQLLSMRALGFSFQQIYRVFAFESLLVSMLGALLGLFLAVGYNELVFLGLNGVWQDIVRTQVLEANIQLSTLILGFGISVVTVFGSLAYNLRRRLKREVSEQKYKEVNPKSWTEAFKFFVMLLSALASLTLIGIELIKANSDANTFFIAGGLLLLSMLLFVEYLLVKWSKKESEKFRFNALIKSNLTLNRKRSLMVVILLSLGAFLVVSTGANRKDLFSNANKPKSGTGAYAFFAETSIPILYDLKNEKVKSEYGLNTKLSFVQMRALEGDDASCLNLNRIERPKVLGVDPAQLNGRFDIATKLDELTNENFWMSLEDTLEGAIPAIADQTVIQWSFGKKVGDTLHYRNERGEELVLKLILGTKASVFQGFVLISDANFRKHFPSSSGSSVFLIDGDTSNAQQDLHMAFKDHGWQMELAPQRLANFKSVENTYLTIFLVLGAFGLLIGTIGLAIVLARSIQQRKSEFALLQATGFAKKYIFKLVFAEYSTLLLTGLFIGMATALLSVLPSLIRSSDISVNFIMIILSILVTNGLLWVYVVAKHQLKKLDIVVDIKDE